MGNFDPAAFAAFARKRGLSDDEIVTAIEKQTADVRKAGLGNPGRPTMMRPDESRDPIPSGMDERDKAFGTEEIGREEAAARSGAEGLLPGAHKLMAVGAAVGDKLAQVTHPGVQAQPFNEVRQEEDATAAERLRRGSLQHPGVAFGANMVGGALSPLGKAVKGAGVFRSMANGAIYGAAQGGAGAEGAGGDFGDIAKGTLFGAGGGAAGGAVGHAVGKAPEAISKKIHGMSGPIGEDLRMMDKHGGEPSFPAGVPQRPIVKGTFDKEPIASMSGSKADIGEASRGSAESILTEQGSRNRVMGNDFAKRSSAIMRSPEGQQIADVTPLVNHADKLLQSEATSDELRGRLSNFINDRMARYLQPDGTYRMSVSTLHDLKSTLSEMASVGEGSATREDAQMATLWKMAQEGVHNHSPAFKALDAEYAAGIGKLRSEQEALGVKRREGVAQNNPKNARTMTTAIAGQGADSTTAGGKIADIERFRALAPQHETSMDVPLMLKAKQRMSFPSPLELKGGAIKFIGRNIEPTVGRVIDPAIREAAATAPRAGSAAAAELLLGRRKVKGKPPLRGRVTEPTDDEIAIAGQPGMNEALARLLVTGGR